MTDDQRATVKRYDIDVVKVIDRWDWTTLEDAEGLFVKYDDIAPLLAELDRTKAHLLARCREECAPYRPSGRHAPNCAAADLGIQEDKA